MNGLQSQPAWRSPFPNQKLHETKSFQWPLDISTSQRNYDKGFLKYRRFQFEAGHSIGHPSKWSLFLISCSNNNNTITSGAQKVKESFDDVEFLGLFLDKMDPESIESIELQQEEAFYTEFVVRCNIEVSMRNGNLVNSRDVETLPREEISEGYWGWRKVSPILKSHHKYKSMSGHKSTAEPSSPGSSDIELIEDSELELALRITFTISGHPKDLLNKIPSSHMKLLEKEQNFEREIAMTFYNWALSGKTDFDFVIETEDRKQFLVHKDILGARSPVFRRMFETSMTESSLGIAVIDDISSETLHCILRHVYTGQVELEWLGRPKLASELVYSSGKYWLTSLRNYCDKHLVRAATRKNCIGLLELASLHDLEMATVDLTRFVQEKMTLPRSLSGLRSTASRFSIRDSGDEEDSGDEV